LYELAVGRVDALAVAPLVPAVADAPAPDVTLFSTNFAVSAAAAAPVVPVGAELSAFARSRQPVTVTLFADSIEGCFAVGDGCSLDGGGVCAESETTPAHASTANVLESTLFI
jgi:hypothetical protein